MSTQPPFLPQKIADLAEICGNCGTIVRPDLWTRHEEPFIPIYPDGTKGEKGAWFQQTTEQECSCGSKISFNLNPKPFEHHVFFYGDDAERQVGPYDQHAYSFIGATSGPLQDIDRELAALKVKYVPDRDPKEWRIHTTEMMDPKKRILKSPYKNFEYSEVIDFFSSCADILRAREPYLWNAHIFGFLKTPSDRRIRGKALKEAKIISHIAILSNLIYMATSQSLLPIFTMDASKPVKNYPHIEGWSYDSFLGSKNFLAHAFLAHGQDIPAPSFLPPGSHPCLELADVHAFFAARDAFCRALGKAPELPLEKFGKFTYLAMIDGNRVEPAGQTGIADRYIPKIS
ncbi:hypothetical protein NKH19_24255 [Mesorhizobium sp. M1338]|uniref:hypothetical protein n=1 Tax=unclassified Mesorhizobium TaxID=325217 RepID=UPI003336A080